MYNIQSALRTFKSLNANENFSNFRESPCIHKSVKADEEVVNICNNNNIIKQAAVDDRVIVTYNRVRPAHRTRVKPQFYSLIVFHEDDAVNLYLFFFLPNTRVYPIKSSKNKIL